ncbi:ParB/RepB/Spo0J family partition protein [Candidatus Hepatincolaceae symbiont of Richtersius coronifer]
MINKDNSINLASIINIKDKGKSPSALGKGISALLGDAKNNTAKVNFVAEVIKVDLNECIPSPYQARKIFNTEELEQLSESIRNKGVIQPILLRKINPNQYEIIAGERRCKAARLTGLSHIPAILMSLSDKEMMEIGLIENLQRKDLNPIEEASAYKNLLEIYHYTHEEIGVVVGKSRSYISNYLRILSLPKEVVDLIAADKLTAGHAKMLVSAENPKELAFKIINQDLSVRDTESFVKESRVKEALKLKENNHSKSNLGNSQTLDSQLVNWIASIHQQYPNINISIAAKKPSKSYDYLNINSNNKEEMRISYTNVEDLKKILKV